MSSFSGSIWGGIIGTASYFFNHSEVNIKLNVPSVQFSYTTLQSRLVSSPSLLKGTAPNHYRYQSWGDRLDSPAAFRRRHFQDLLQ